VKIDPIDDPEADATSEAPFWHAFDGVVTFSNLVGTSLIVVLAIVINVDVFGRALFSRPLVGVPEIAGMAIITIVYLQIASCLRTRQLTRSDGLLKRLARTSARAASALEGIHHLVGCLLFLIIAHAAWRALARAWIGNEFEGVAGIIQFPVWPVKAAVTLGSFLIAVQFARVAARCLRRALRPAA
jgi:TRAP-type C4-dicarboxylate transport system permease small subunit